VPIGVGTPRRLTAKLKHWLREAEKRTTDAVFNALGPILDTLSPVECANYFANAGYDQT
jgi:transposase